MAKSNAHRGVMTQAVHAGERPDPTTGASAPAINMSSTFVVEDLAGFSANDLGEESGYLYGRWANPTVTMLEEKIAALEGTEACCCFGSGMAAATAIFLSELSSGDHAIVSDVSYAGVAELVRDTLPRFGIEVDLVNMTDLSALEAALKPNTRLVHVETPVNPLTRITDLAAVAKLAHDAGARVSCDSTFASPIATRPADYGVDYVMHSITKYIGGHGDAIGGCVATTKALAKQLNVEATVHYGGVLSPFNAWLIARGAATLPIRMRAHEETALTVAHWLEGHPKVGKVLYPGLTSHPQHELATRQMNNFSGMMSFQVGSEADGERIAERMTTDLEVIHYAVSLGHHRSLIFWMPTAGLMDSSFKLTGANLAAYRSMAGDGIFRLSVGLEDPEDLIADLDRVLG
ncbi:MAG: PLP-dependent aspartate aminotransferase family protein [Alphaproteobacteria bacterium]|nr:PLP-dependent aspartate aminotransferase family protein [Alphaproteobacteria bacterium]